MKKTTIVTSACLRYIVPFTYGISFDDACALVDRQQTQIRRRPGEYRKLWNRCISPGLRSESDLYDFIREEFLFSDDSGEQSKDKMGARWLYWSSREYPSKQGIPMEQLLFLEPALLKNFADASEEEQQDIFRNAIKLRLTNLGLFLFRNNLGLIWYELEPDEKDLDSARLVEMQTLIKELNRKNAIYLWASKKRGPSDFPSVCYKDKKRRDRAAVPFSLGQWISEKIDFLPKKYLVERKSTYLSLKKSFDKLLGTCKLLVIMPEEETGEDTAACTGNMPDKAVLYTYCTFLEKQSAEVGPAAEKQAGESQLPAVKPAAESGAAAEKQAGQSGLPAVKPAAESEAADEGNPIWTPVTAEMKRLAYNLTNGYTDSYDCGSETCENMKYPFNRAIWFVTKEGAGYFKWISEGNRRTYENLIRFNFSSDYFTLFIKALYQSYTLMLMAKQIQEEIPAERVDKMTDAEYEKIGRMFEAVNQFLTKSIVTSVSHIHHQGDFYIYSKEQLRIAEDARSVSAGLEALDALQKEQRHRKKLLKIEDEKKLEKQRDDEVRRRDEIIQDVMGMISLLAIASAFVDCFDFVAKFSSNTNDGWWSLRSSPGILATEVLLCFLIFCVSVYAIWIVAKNKKERHKFKKKQDQEGKTSE